MKKYVLALGIYDNEERIKSYSLVEKDQKFDAMLDFPHFYAAKLVGTYDELIKDKYALIEMETYDKGELISVEEVEIPKN